LGIHTLIANILRLINFFCRCYRVFIETKTEHYELPFDDYVSSVFDLGLAILLYSVFWKQCTFYLHRYGVL